jgi:hypothetical protein
MSLFDGLYPYEVVLLILGALFFLLLAVLLVLLVVRGKPYTGMLAFFAIPIVMIGYSSIQEITFQDGAVTIQKTTAQLQAAPTDGYGAVESRERGSQHGEPPDHRPFHANEHRRGSIRSGQP